MELASNLNPLTSGLFGEANTNPVDFSPEVDELLVFSASFAGMPNVNFAVAFVSALEVLTPKVKPLEDPVSDLAALLIEFCALAGMPNEKFDLTIFGSFLSAPGFKPPQATHSVSSALFCTMHESHDHAPSGFLNLSPQPEVVVDFAVVVGAAFEALPGFGFEQHTHVLAVSLFLTIHEEHSQELVDGLNFSIRSELAAVDVFDLSLAASRLDFFGPMLIELGLAALQHGHVMTVLGFLSMQPEHSQDPSAGLNLSIRSNFSEDGVVVEPTVLLDGSELFGLGVVHDTHVVSSCLFLTKQEEHSH